MTCPVAVVVKLRSVRSVPQLVGQQVWQLMYTWRLTRAPEARDQMVLSLLG